MGYCIVLTTTATREEADKIADNGRLARISELDF
jgi:hypothetical protein